MRTDNNVTSVKRSGVEEREGVTSPYTDTREQPGTMFAGKIKRRKLLKSREGAPNLQNQNNASKESIKQDSQNSKPYYPVQMKSSTIVNQLNQQRWKSTLHGRGIRPRFFAHKKQEVSDSEDSSPPSTQNKNGPTLKANNNGRSASFQPSVLRRREGNKLEQVDLRQEMLQNIRRRRKGKFWISNLVEDEGDEKEREPMIHVERKANRPGGVKKIVIKERGIKEEDD